LYELTNAKLYNLTTSTTTGNTTTVTPKAGVTLESSAAAARRAGVTITFVTKLVVPKAEGDTFKAALEVQQSPTAFLTEMAAIQADDTTTFASVAVPLAANLTITAPSVVSVDVPVTVSSAATVTTSVMAMAVAALAASQARQ